MKEEGKGRKEERNGRGRWRKCVGGNRTGGGERGGGKKICVKIGREGGGKEEGK